MSTSSYCWRSPFSRTISRWVTAATVRVKSRRAGTGAYEPTLTFGFLSRPYTPQANYLSASGLVGHVESALNVGEGGNKLRVAFHYSYGSQHESPILT